MIILTLRTDKTEAEIGLYDNEKQLAYEIWYAHRELAETIHKKLAEILDKASKELNDIGGVVCFKGPGSFTGLRIGLTVGNALARAGNKRPARRPKRQNSTPGIRRRSQYHKTAQVIYLFRSSPCGMT
jgi:tRNA A37 threonylcarbamoyladenosine modification protein TsaB